MADSKHQVPLHELPVDDVTDKITPGWFVGCKLSLKKYMELAEDWKLMKGLNDDLKAQVAACRFRLKGPARELVDANRALKRGPPVGDQEQGEVLEAYNTEWKNFFQILKDNYGERDQKVSEERTTASAARRSRSTPRSSTAATPGPMRRRSISAIA